MTDDGQVLADMDADRAFEYGDAVPDAETGMLLPVVRTLADAHGWETMVETGYQDGFRVRIKTTG